MQIQANYVLDPFKTEIPVGCIPDIPQRNRIHLIGSSPVSVSQLNSSLLYIQNALEQDIYPELCHSCTGGTYFCLNEFGSEEAVFKPLDEEPYCENNPQGLSPSSCTSVIDRGVLPGTAGLREVAAFFLDHFHFAGVPETLLAILVRNHPLRTQIGSLQLYVPHECSSEDYGPVKFSVVVWFS